uniref:Reverse transcriptase domain-containing protein n=1 Tax=Tanacetum cinerariifolium TaxID=118510 RepID=A0A699HLR2_TANCI|nr:reverse transcriptase domain-containing protein [Tanacetum cinerariifolium]
MLLDFDDVQDVSDDEIEVNMKGKAKMGDEDLSKPFKEILKCPFTRRIVKFSSPGHKMPVNAKIYDGIGDLEDHVGRFVGIGNQGEWPMPVWCRMFLQTLDGKARAWFDKLPPCSIVNWGNLQRKFLNRFKMLKACEKDPIKISKIVGRANEILPNFKERWVSESNVIPNIHVLMQISSFMSSHKCPELSKRFSDNIPKMVDEMLKRMDDYLRSKEAFRNTDRKPEHNPAFKRQKHHAPYALPHRFNQEFRRPRETKAVLTLDSLVSTPEEILATEHQLHLPQPAPLVGYLDVRQRGTAEQRSTERQSNQHGTMPRSEEKNHDDRRKVDERPNNIFAGFGTRFLEGGFGSRGRNRRVSRPKDTCI